jgi:SAM-dependent methyltransferase
MQMVKCYNCQSNKNTFYASENSFNLVKCNECGLLFVNPRPDNEEISRAHKVGVHRGSEELHMTGSFSLSKISIYRDIFKDIYGDDFCLDNISWLDIGCGHGEFLLALQQVGGGRIIAKGLEPNAHKQKSAQERGLDVSNFEIDEHNEKYDVISLLNVYSHLPDPPAILLDWKRLLMSGGELLLETGDTASLLSKNHYRPFDLPDHLSFASEKIVVDILERVGFEIVSVNKYPYLRIRHCFLQVGIWPRSDGMSRKKSAHHMVVQGMNSGRREKRPSIEGYIAGTLQAYGIRKAISGQVWARICRYAWSAISCY